MMTSRKEISLLLLVCCQITFLTGAKSDRMLLEDLKVLTLQDGKMTNYRRSSAVPQLKCVGGTAGCSSFRPQTVQCHNRGSDGYDVQWECKTDMDNSYRFGKVQVSCEGYEYADDPYILKGSCGLEYTIDLTQEGYQQKNDGGHHYGDGYHDRSQNQNQHGYTKKASSVFQDLIYLGILAGIVYIIYKTCIAPSNQQQQPDAPPSYDDTFRNQGNQGNQGNQQPPPYGFRQDMPNNGGSCSSGAGYTNTNTHSPPGANTQGGFWTGAMSGGILGYLFGRNNSYGNTYQQPYAGGWGGRQGWGTGWGNSWGSGWGNRGGNSWGSGLGSGWGSRTHNTSHSSGFSSAPRSSGTRTASGFGGTTRR